MSTKHDRMLERIKKHGEQLNAIFETEYDADTLCRKLRRIEVKAEQLAVDYANGEIETDDWEAHADKILNSVNKVLKYRDDSHVSIPVIFNSDPRGYALKIDDEYVRANNLQIHRDWGGYGILAPDLSED